ncbi:GntR family transcriptional regulator [Sphingomonas glaciei]|uniref:GntR family transcriptional regulator n=1 Tax=Sphingomonas glaciei TaxID=2938948 RepID=A0ABY5N189_9SPHN|nr:GntR family transcriptional regulator [Sphingomonas glaciei]UUR08356.1 GntR family transcriptional regulator [Sphingomonas glaciei]
MMVEGHGAAGRVARHIRQLIVEGVLEPGARVAEATLAERLGVSRTPVRNALPVLASEGLLEPVGKRGFAVRAFTKEESYAATELRCVLEGYAARKLALREDRAPVVEQLREAMTDGDAIFTKGFLEREDEDRYAAMNRRFHDLVVSGAGDSLLQDMIQRVYAIPFVAPDVVAFNRIPAEEIFPILMSAQHQHHAMIDAIAAGQADFAESLMRGHSAAARRSLGLEERFDEAPISGAA